MVARSVTLLRRSASVARSVARRALLPGTDRRTVPLTPLGCRRIAVSSMLMTRGGLRAPDQIAFIHWWNTVACTGNSQHVGDEATLVWGLPDDPENGPALLDTSTGPVLGARETRPDLALLIQAPYSRPYPCEYQLTRAIKRRTSALSS